MMIKCIVLSTLAVSLFVSCGDDSSSSEIAPKAAKSPRSNISAKGVVLVSYSVEAGNPSIDAIETGLQSAADTLSSLYAESLKTYPDLTGNIRGAFHIEPDGTVRTFMAKGAQFSPEEGKSISSDFIGATFGKKYSFPAMGESVLLKIDFQLKP